MTMLLFTDKHTGRSITTSIVSTRQSKGLGSNNQACLSNLLKFTLLRTHRKSPHISSSATVSIRATTAGRMHICTATVTGKPLNDYPLTHQPPPPYTNTTQPVCCIPTVSQLASVRGGGADKRLSQPFLNAIGQYGWQ